MFQYFEAFLFIFIPLFSWFLISYNLLIRDKIRLDIAIKEMAEEFQEKQKLIPILMNAINQYLPFSEGAKQRIIELNVNFEECTNIYHFLTNINLLENQLLVYIKQIDNNTDANDDQIFNDLKHHLSQVDIRVKKFMMQYHRTAKHLNIRLGTFPANMFAKFFRIKPAEQLENKH